jgi:putative transposase
MRLQRPERVGTRYGRDENRPHPWGQTIKKWPYKLAHKYNPIVQKEIEAMLVVGIIYPIDKSEWESLMVMQPKKHDPKKLRICVDFRGLNKLTVIDPFSMSFTDEIINEVMGHECYSFIDGFSPATIRYLSQKKIREKTTFVSEFGSFAYK